MWLIELFTAIFKTWDSTNEVVKKALPSEKIQEEKFELKKETLAVAEDAHMAEKRNKIADEMFHDLRPHPELSVEDKVNYELQHWPESERKQLIKIIADRLEANDHYQKRKQKKSKFRFFKP